MTPKIRILVVDDEPLAREGIVAMLAQDPEATVASPVTSVGRREGDPQPGAQAGKRRKT